MWNCPTCGESGEEQFDLCWKCQSPRARVIEVDAAPVAHALPPPLPPPMSPCGRCDSPRVVPVRAWLCADCGNLVLAADHHEGLWEGLMRPHDHARPSFGLPPPEAAREEWQEHLPSALGARIICESVEAQGSFDAYLPLAGKVIAELPDAGTEPSWLLLALNEPFSATLQTGVSFRFQRLEVESLLVQAELGAGRNPRAWKRVGAVLIPLEKGRSPPRPTIAAHDYAHSFRARCSAAEA